MSRSFHRKKQLTAISEINVTSLIDLAFALLIIFMITTPLLEQSIELQLPVETVSPQVETDLEFVTLSIDAEGNYYLGDQLVQKEGLSNQLAGLSKQARPPVIKIRADARLPYQKVITVIDLLKQYALTDISLDTVTQ